MITNFVRYKEKIVPGNDYKLFVGVIDDITSTTFSGNTLTDIVTSASAEFAEIQADWNSLLFESNTTATRGVMSEQTMTGRFSKKSKELIDLVESLQNNANAGLVLIRKDGHNQYFVSGIAPIAKMAANRPYLSVQTNFTTGANVTDTEEGNKYEIIFTRNSGTEEYMLDSSLGNSIDNESATFITFN